MISQSPPYPWYARIEDASLEQGDFFFGCPIMMPTAPEAMADPARQSLESVISEYDVIILSQSCDLVAGKLENVLVCPFWPLDKAAQYYPMLRSPKDQEAVRRGNIPGMHMVGACDLQGFVSSVRIISFRSVFSLPFGYVQALAVQGRPRLRLLPPYREHLAQAFARFIMRVGLPVDIPAFR